jgi:hypothetical protein
MEDIGYIKALKMRMLKFIIYIILFCWVANRIYSNYINGEKKPFWKGTDTIQVCKVPYYSNDDCYKLNVKLVDNKNTQIFFDNGGYIFTRNLTCYFASEYLNTPRYVFCRSWDNNGQQWDFMPIWAYYPSTKDIEKSIENL